MDPFFLYILTLKKGGIVDPGDPDEPGEPGEVPACNDPAPPTISTLSALTSAIPATHPYLFCKASQKEALRAKLNLPEFASVKNTVNNYGRPWARAFKYFLFGNNNDADYAIDTNISELQTVISSNDWKKVRQGFSRVTEMAWIYDLCHARIMARGKGGEYRTLMKNVINEYTPGWPPDKNRGAISGHEVEGGYYNQMLASLAIRNEDDTNYKNIVDDYFKRHAPVRNFFAGSKAYHQGTYYLGVRVLHDILTLAAIYNISGKWSLSPDYKHICDEIIYTWRDDSRFWSIADVENQRVTNGENYAPLKLIAALFNYGPAYAYIKKVGANFDRSDQLGFIDLIAFLFEKPLDQRNDVTFNQLETIRYHCPPIGPILTHRSGWGNNHCIIQIRGCQYYWGNHWHKGDHGTFQIYGFSDMLALKSGYYDGGVAGKGCYQPHDRGYLQQSVSANSLLIEDPNEQAPTNFFLSFSNGTKGPPPDGGIRWPYIAFTDGDKKNAKDLDALLNPANGFEMCVERAHAWGGGVDPTNRPEWSYISIDLTKGYTGKAGTPATTKASKVYRNGVVINTGDADRPMILIMYDVIDPLNSNWNCKFLLHSEQQPDISGNQFSVQRGYDTGYNTEGVGELSGHFFTPTGKSVDIDFIGGAGNQFTIKGVNYNRDCADTDRYAEEGVWRIEATQKGSQVRFLTPMLIHKKTVQPFVMSKFEGSNYIGVRFLDRAVIFHKDGGKFDANQTFDIGADGNYKVLVADVKTGSYDVGESVAGQNVLSFNTSQRTISLIGSTSAPQITYINLSGLTVRAGATPGTLIGLITSNGGTGTQYNLSGVDAERFYIIAGRLYVNESPSIDYGNYTFFISASNSNNTLTIPFTITILEPIGDYYIQLSNQVVDEFSPSGTVVGDIITNIDSPFYTLGGADANLFLVQNNKLVTNTDAANLDRSKRGGLPFFLNIIAAGHTEAITVYLNYKPRSVTAGLAEHNITNLTSPATFATIPEPAYTLEVYAQISAGASSVMHEKGTNDATNGGQAVVVRNNEMVARIGNGLREDDLDNFDSCFVHLPTAPMEGGVRKLNFAFQRTTDMNDPDDQLIVQVYVDDILIANKKYGQFAAMGGAFGASVGGNVQSDTRPLTGESPAIWGNSGITYHSPWRVFKGIPKV